MNLCKTTYINESGQTVAFPDFEPVSGTFEVEVEDVAYYSFSVNSNDSDYISFDINNGNAQSRLLANTTKNVYINLHGQSSSDINTLFSQMQNYLRQNFVLNNNLPYTFFINAADVTATGSTEFTTNVLLQLTKMKGIIMPDCVSNYTRAIFQSSNNLEYVKFGESTKVLNLNTGSMSDNLFVGCTILKEVEFTNTVGWYHSDEPFETEVDWTSSQLSQVDVSNPEVNAANILNGTWKYLYRKTE